MSPNSCCSKVDCHTTQAEIRGSEWWARLGHHKDNDWELTEWVRIPKLSIISGHDNPTGEAVICHDNVGTIDATGHKYHPNPESVIVFCFVPPDES